MPALKNPKWELFAQELAKGATADAAYVAAGYKANRCNAARLKTNENILTRVAELVGEVARQCELTLATHLEKLADIRDAAMAAGQYSAAVSAEVSRGKAVGLYIERHESTVDMTNRIVTDRPLTDDEWEKQYGINSAADPTKKLINFKVAALSPPLFATGSVARA